jgi:hypothetical protein
MTTKSTSSKEASMPHETVPSMPGVASEAGAGVGEPRWPMALAVISVMVMGLLTEQSLAIIPSWLPPLIYGVLLAILIVGDPGRIDKTTPWLRRTSITLVTLMMAGAMGGTALLVYLILNGNSATETALPLLVAGAKVWLTNNVAFALLYWQFDCGGPAQRAQGMPPYPDFAFPQTFSPEFAPPGWKPQFVDYLYVGFTTANAFSPTDTMPMRSWAKLAMGTQALISFAIVGLVLAKAVSEFGVAAPA